METSISYFSENPKIKVKQIFNESSKRWIWYITIGDLHIVLEDETAKKLAFALETRDSGGG